MDKTDKCQTPAADGKFSFQSVQEARDLARYLRALADGFEAGDMRFTRKDMELAMSPGGLVGFAVEAKAKDGRMKLSLKFAWREAVEEKESENGFFEITPGEKG